MSDKDRCLRAAEECRRLARRTASAEDRNTLLNMAQLWCELAESADVEHWADAPAPQAQLRRRS